MSTKCPQCREGYLHASVERPGTVVCNICEYRPPVSDSRTQAIELLRSAQRQLALADFDLDALRRGRQALDKAVTLLR